jgi:hypothetical protein
LNQTASRLRREAEVVPNIDAEGTDLDTYNSDIAVDEHLSNGIDDDPVISQTLFSRFDSDPSIGGALFAPFGSDPAINRVLFSQGMAVL